MRKFRTQLAMAFSVVQRKSLATNTTNQKLSFDIDMVRNLQNIFMIFGIKEKLIIDPYNVGYCY